LEDEMTTATLFRFTSLLAASAVILGACSSSGGAAGKGSSVDAGHPAQDAGGGGGGGGGGAGGGGAAAIKCGAQQCSLPAGAGVEQVTACCTDANECGLKHPAASKCLVPAAGTASPVCSAFTPPPVPGSPPAARLDGCCGPAGCGALDAFVGCMPNSALGKAEVACDPTNNCTSVNALPCDGAEDCPKGQFCCGLRESQSTYTGFGCFASCLTAPGATATAGWVQICHAGEACEDKSAGVACTTSQLLPPTLARCLAAGGSAPPSATPTAGEIRCGTKGLLCSPGESCCFRPPRDPYCTAAGVACDCKHAP
jgi:hypothetical protein